MMLIDHLRIVNYRSFTDVNIHLPEYLILVGRNNAGKSNILSALNLLLEGSSRDLSLEDFHRNTQSAADEIVIEAQIIGVQAFLSLCAEQHRPKIESCLEKDSIRIRRIAKSNLLSLGKLEIWQPAKGEYGTPTGLDIAFKQFLPEVIFIEAFKDPSTETQSNKTTTILSKLLKQIVEQVGEKVDIDIKKALSVAHRKFNIIEENGQITDERPEELKRIQQRINNHVREIFLDSEARLVFALPDLDAMMATASIELRDHTQGPWTTPILKGQGFQRALYVALLEALADELRHANVEGKKPIRPFILLFEEPDIFLHPSLQREIGNILETISRSNQVVIVTHSPVLVTPQRIDNVIIVRQMIIEETGVQSKCICPDTNALRDSDDKHLTCLLKYANSAEFLFADYVIVVEGPSDRELLNASWSRLKKDGVQNKNLALAVIDAGSKAVVPIWVQCLKSLGLSAVGVVDLDFLWDGAGKVLGSDVILSQMIGEFWKICDERGFSEDNNGNHRIQSCCKQHAFKIISEELQKQYQQVREALFSRSIWVLKIGEIEDYFELRKSSKGQFTVKAQKILRNEVEVPQEIQQILIWGTGD